MNTDQMDPDNHKYESSRSALKTSKKQYQKVVSAVHHQTSPKQPPMAEKGVIKRTCCVSGDLSPDTVTSKLQRAVTNGDLIEANGRYCVTDDLDRLLRAAQAVAEQVPVDNNLLAELNTAIHELRNEEGDTE